METNKMEEMNLKNLNRKELIEIFYQMKLKEEELEKELKETKEKLEDRSVRLEKAGSIAEASLSLNHVFETAQKSADEYLASIEEMKQKYADQLAHAEEDAKQILEQAKKSADEYYEKVNEKCLKLQEQTDIKIKEQEEISNVKMQKVEAQCSQKLIETEQEVEKKWADYQARVDKVLQAHSDLLAFLKPNQD